MSLPEDIIDVPGSRFSDNPVVELLPDGRNGRLYRDFSYTDTIGREHMAHKGMITDGGSIPRFLWRLIGSPFTGVARPAYIIHDKYCYKANDLEGAERAELRLSADKLLLEILEYLGVKKWRLKTIYTAVRIFSRFSLLIFIF